MDENINQKIELVDKGIDEFSRNLATDDKDLQGKLKAEIREIILQNDLKSSNEETATLIKTLTGENSEANTETIVKAKEASLGLARWTVENIEAVRAYRGEDLKTKLVEETKKNNSNMTDDHIRIIRRLADNINSVYNIDGGIEDQKDVILEEHKNESPGKIKNSWNDTRGIVGLMKKSPEQLDEIVKNDEEINRDIQKYGIKINYQQSDILASYDRVMNMAKKPEVKKSINSSGSRFKTLDKISNGKFSQITNIFLKKSAIKNNNGFASKIGNEDASGFVQKTIDNLLQNDFTTSTKSILNGFRGIPTNGPTLSGIKSTIVGGTNNWTTNVGNFLKKSTSNISSKLGIGAKNFIANNFGKIGGSLVKGLNAAVTLPTKLIGSLGIKTVAPFIIGFFLLFFLLGVIQNNQLISALVNIDSENSNINNNGEDSGLYTNNMNPIPISGKTVPCELEMSNYQEILMSKVNAAGFRTREAVATAAKYLSSEFEYKIPYYWGGGHNSDVTKDKDGGFIDDSSDGLKRKWGCKFPPDSGGRTLMGLDCSGFVTWCYLTAGFKDWSGSSEYRYNKGSFEYVYFGKNDCNELASRVKPGDVLKSDGHTGIILWVEGTIAKNAQSTPRGLIVEYTDLCNGKGVNGSKNDFPAIVLMENYFIKNK